MSRGNKETLSHTGTCSVCGTNKKPSHPVFQKALISHERFQRVKLGDLNNSLADASCSASPSNAFFDGVCDSTHISGLEECRLTGWCHTLSLLSLSLFTPSIRPARKAAYRDKVWGQLLPEPPLPQKTLVNQEAQCAHRSLDLDM